jgi:CHASE1-domain containing sensor protein
LTKQWQFSTEVESEITVDSDNSKIYLLAGVGGATMVCLLIALIAILARKRD